MKNLSQYNSSVNVDVAINDLVEYEASSEISISTMFSIEPIITKDMIFTYF